MTVQLAGSMRFLVGTSGYSFKERKGHFYPEKLPQKEMLRYYPSSSRQLKSTTRFTSFPVLS